MTAETRVRHNRFLQSDDFKLLTSTYMATLLVWNFPDRWKAFCEIVSRVNANVKLNFYLQSVAGVDVVTVDSVNKRTSTLILFRVLIFYRIIFVSL